MPIYQSLVLLGAFAAIMLMMIQNKTTPVTYECPDGGGFGISTLSPEDFLVVERVLDDFVVDMSLSSVRVVFPAWFTSVEHADRIGITLACTAKKFIESRQ